MTLASFIQPRAVVCVSYAHTAVLSHRSVCISHSTMRNICCSETQNITECVERWCLGMHQMFGNRNCLAENRKKYSFGVRPKRPNNLYRTMTLCDQIEASTTAANTSALWKHLKLSERDADIISTKHRQRETA